MRTHLSTCCGLLFNTFPLTSPLSRLTMARSNTSKPKVDKLQQLLHSDPSGGWDKCWEKGMTPWDLGQPTPILVHLHQTGTLPKGRALIPGCGSGHDVVAIASPERFVVGLDVSENAIKQATKLFSSSKSAENFAFLEADFFSWRPTQLFDLIFDYTFFCAIEPEMRSRWASKIRDLLKPDGELITLIFPEVLCYAHVIDIIEDPLVFQVSILQDINEIVSLNVFAVPIETSVTCPLYRKGEGGKDSCVARHTYYMLNRLISDHEGGPPYKVSVSNYEEVLHPMGIRAESIVENHLAIPPRRGREKLGRWKRSICKSLL
ncbi:hypothetical protein MTR67_034233 [Solanum verrucosum]|uniref:Thiol methyltransferase 2 n=1 Tax=Solanum verrucosum TaxID=315347 RepID=A0AAF0ZK51_SOLVR|nr:hypothetical protein MTR67_034233 [Solanum verrucosum]